MSTKKYAGFTEQEILEDMKKPGQDTTYFPIILTLFEEIRSMEDTMDWMAVRI